MRDDDCIFVRCLLDESSDHALLIMVAYYEKPLAARAETALGLRASSVVGPFEDRMRALGWRGPEPPGFLDRER